MQPSNVNEILFTIMSRRMTEGVCLMIMIVGIVCSETLMSRNNIVVRPTATPSNATKPKKTPKPTTTTVVNSATEFTTKTDERSTAATTIKKRTTTETKSTTMATPLVDTDEMIMRGVLYKSPSIMKWIVMFLLMMIVVTTITAMIIQCICVHTLHDTVHPVCDEDVVLGGINIINGRGNDRGGGVESGYGERQTVGTDLKESVTYGSFRPEECRL